VEAQREASERVIDEVRESGFPDVALQIVCQAVKGMARRIETLRETVAGKPRGAVRLKAAGEPETALQNTSNAA
jgi:hypothetical protein